MTRRVRAEFDLHELDVIVDALDEYRRDRDIDDETHVIAANTADYLETLLDEVRS